MTAITPYRISVTDTVLADLKSRLRNTRWPEAELVTDLSQGAPFKWIREICEYWEEEYDWRRREARLNRRAIAAPRPCDAATPEINTLPCGAVGFRTDGLFMTHILRK